MLIPMWFFVGSSAGGMALTVTVQVFEVILDPSVEAAVICAVPTATPVTAPDALTVAIEGSLEVQLSVWFVAFAGSTVAAIVAVEPTATVAVFGIVTLATGVLAAGFTVKLCETGVAAA